jgi:hypothetical protein
MEIAVVAVAIAAFLLLLVPASLLPLLAGAALGADTIDGAERHRDHVAESVGEPGWSDDEPIAA